MTQDSNNWFAIPEQKTKWLIKGLITTDDNASFVGKPKSGKSTAIRNLIASVVLRRPFLGREVVPTYSQVLYLHIDRKDRKHQVASDLRHLGITEDEKDQVLLLTEEDFLREWTFEERCDWLIEKVNEFLPDLIIIDLLLQFIKTKKGVNDYDNMIEALAYIQDRLKDAGYEGALVMSLHARKAVSEDVGDSILGSTAIRGSIGTGLYFRQYKKQKQYTVESDQTQRDPALGELEETIVNRDSTTGVITLGARFEDLKREEKKDEGALRRQKLYNCIVRNPDRTVEELAEALSMSKKTVLPLLDALEKSNLIYSTGEGKKGDPKKWLADIAPSNVSNAQVEGVCSK
jgi:hypothetical protein